MDSYFAKSMVISAAVHLAILGGGQFSNFGKLARSPALKDLEVTYCQIKEPPELAKAPMPLKVQKHAQAVEIKNELQDKPQEKSALEKEVPKKAEELPKAPKEELAKKIAPKNQFVKLEKGGSMQTDPAYLSYYQAIRERIREHALYNYKIHSQEGQVYVSFTLQRNGSLVRLAIEDERSDDNNYLKDVAKRSIAQASPFSAFPDELPQQEIAFNVIISFSSGRPTLIRPSR